MADSFFGFNTSLDEIEDGVTFDPSEDEYDALNDETFGEMVDSDWEQQHEEFSLLTEKNRHIDIERALCNLIIDNDEKLPKPLSPLKTPTQAVSVNLPVKTTALPLPIPQNLPSISSLKNVCTVEEIERNLRQQQSLLPNQQCHQQQQPPPIQPQQQKPILPFFQPRFSSGIMGPIPSMMGSQPFIGHPPNQNVPFRAQQQLPNHLPQHNFGNFNMIPPGTVPSGNNPIRPPLLPPGIEHQNLFHSIHFNQQANSFNNQNAINQQRFPINTPQIPHNKQQFPPNQFIQNPQFPHNQPFPPNPPQFPLNQPPIPLNQPQIGVNPPHSTINQQQISQNIQQNSLNQQRPQQNVRNNQPNNINNQNTHLNQHSNKLGNLPNNRGFPSSVFNNCNGPNATKPLNDTNSLIQLIQSTHPMLQNNLHNNFMNPLLTPNSALNRSAFQKHNSNISSTFNNQHIGQQKNDNQRRQMSEADPYSGLMSSKEKQWLLNIQLMQLNTGTPYIDDYYYTVFLERKTKKQREEIKEAHQMNQENHPFSRKNLSKRDNEHRRERCNSTRSNSDNPPPNKDGPRVYVPTQFENSLGKLQCGSVTAPRKIIDMEVIGRESPTGEVRVNSVGSSTAGVIGAPRGTRHILLAIETLYRILLRLEDLSEPLAIANAVILKEREEKQRALQLEQQQNEAMEKGDNEEENLSHRDTTNNFLNNIQRQNSNKPSENVNSNNSTSAHSVLLSQNTHNPVPNLLDENKPDLLGKLFAGLLFEDRLTSFMNIRKGKMLVIRILAQAVPTEKWRAPLGRVWPRLFRALPYALKRDPLILNSLVEHFQRYLSGTEGWAPVSDLCLMLSEESPMAPTSQRSSCIPFRSTTPSLPSRSLMFFIMSSTLGLSLLVAMMERASILPKPPPAAWNNMIKCAGRLATVSGNCKPLKPIVRSILISHAIAADLASGVEESLAEVMS